MKLKLTHYTIMGLLAASVAATPLLSHAQDTSTNAPSTSDQAAPKPHKKHDKLTFHGPVTALDTNAMTLSVQGLDLVITSETKITKDGQPATLADGAVGANAAGSYRKGTDGKLEAVALHFGKGKKKNASGDAAPAAPAPATGNQ